MNLERVVEQPMRERSGGFNFSIKVPESEGAL